MPKHHQAKEPKLHGNLKKAVDKEINKKLKVLPEIKGVDLTASNVQIKNTTPALALLTVIDQGTDINQRVGDKVKLQDITFNAILSGGLNSTSGAGSVYSNSVRIIVFQDMNDDSTAPVIADVLQASTNTVSHMGWLPQNVSKRFRFIYDKLLQVNKIDNSTATSTAVVTYTSDSYRVLRFHKKLSKYSACTWYGNANGNISKGHLYLLLLGDSNTDFPTINYSFRTRYRDF